jgi:predicted lipoprotein with Yx(FWY)xxD motif
MPTKALLRAGIAVLATVGLSACGSSGQSSGTGAAAQAAPTAAATAAKPSTGAATVAVADSRLGKILVDANGRTLYLFQPDKPGRSICTADYLKCPTLWPPLLTKGHPHGGTGVKAALLGVIRRTKPAGQQVTYNGHPLYVYSEDASPGDLKGQGLYDYWYVVSRAGGAIKAR